MTRTPLLITLAAAAALAGCNSESHTIVSGPDEGEPTNVAANANVTLPPSISASKVYRCADNDVVYVDWMSDGTANIRAKKDDNPTHLSAAQPGKPLTAQGFSLNGAPTASSVKIAVPGQSEETCKA
ncbi:hypothetical protein [Sphingomonas hankyongi]|uniref:C-type lysozyme inhibitor domain-containing protein n=1 Tax=Sphingomonas hankyongi TaxID=2908209 RepID=A0ABT0RZX3_9SPHN|nr:hypothetical protein [Sphingomonas hankyongi]MCL6728946.1 hypothetical protein [Sphingomonas hankyongi]